MQFRAGSRLESASGPGPTASSALSAPDRERSGCSAQTFSSLLPAKPYCADEVRDGLLILPVRQALTKRHVQLNGPSTFRFMIYDIDYPGAYFASRDGILPPPNVVMINKHNKHAHYAYMLETPVARHSAARLAPLRYFSAVETGFTRRLGADHFFAGLIAKNPLHPDWLVEWTRQQPYSLGELHDWLFPRDLRWQSRPEHTFGASRNVACFDVLRNYAYANVLAFKKSGGSVDGLAGRLFDLALTVNNGFAHPLGIGEIRAIAKSVAKWVWQRFTDQTFRAMQARRGMLGAERRWAGHISVEDTKPWLAQGVSRATYYRTRAAKAVVEPD